MSCHFIVETAGGSLLYKREFGLNYGFQFGKIGKIKLLELFMSYFVVSINYLLSFFAQNIKNNVSFYRNFSP